MALSITQLPVEFEHVGNEMFCTLQTSLALSTPNLRIRLEIVVETVYQVGTNIIIALEPRKPDANGRVRFHLHDHMADMFARQIDVPTVGGTVPARCNHLIRRYYLHGYEISGAVPAVTDILAGGSMNGWFYAVNGGITKELWLEKPYFNTGGWFDTFTSLPFYEWPSTSPIRTSRTQDQWSYLFYGKALPGMTFSEDFYLSVRLTWDDGTTYTFTTTPVTIQAGQVWMIPTGFAQLGIPAQETTFNKKCLQYLVRAAYVPSSIYGPSRTYVVDHQYYEWHQEVIYKDGLGVMVPFLLRGRPKTVTESERERAGSYHEYQQPKYLGDFAEHDLVVTNGKVQSTGGLDALEQKKAVELLASTKILVKDDRLGWVPVRLKTGGIRYSPLENARVLDFEWAEDRIDSVTNMFNG